MSIYPFRSNNSTRSLSDKTYVGGLGYGVAGLLFVCFFILSVPEEPCMSTRAPELQVCSSQQENHNTTNHIQDERRLPAPRHSPPSPPLALTSLTRPYLPVIGISPPTYCDSPSTIFRGRAVHRRAAPRAHSRHEHRRPPPTTSSARHLRLQKPETTLRNR